MNVLSRKLHKLESNVLDFPPKDDDILLHIGNSDEQLLHVHASENRQNQSLNALPEAIGAHLR